jgi:hypothetical protein
MAKTLAILNGILGLWLVVAAFLNFGASVNLWNYLIVGVLVAIFGFWGAGAKNA